ncbi:unnamed protein product [Parnassius apollo]|uniref:(apollo) hypothetical protein n=1 Tax=Parnassius apollo TaxID=110799 RepID=A0A8S3X556_PARAO|nr:unnamed protein product [Parnassius apollo]
MVVTYLIVGLFVTSSNTIVLADMSEENGACDTLFNDMLLDQTCCISERFPEDQSKCKIPEDEDKMCDFYKCVVAEQNVLTDDEIDEGKLKEFFDQWEKDYPKEKAMTLRARTGCLNGKYLEYINKDNCLEARLYFCMYINSFMECQSWKESDRCTKVKEHAQKCKDVQGMK